MILSNALSDICVLDFTQLAAGPICTMLLGDMGADVIKIESPEGDLARKLGPPWANGESVTFLAMNRNKRSVALNLKESRGREVVLGMARQADIVVESFRPGVTDRLGVGYDDLRKVNPKLIYCGITAYGQEGPWRNKPGVDGVLHAQSGLMSIIGEEGSPPTKAQAPLIDTVTGFLAVSAILAALRSRDQRQVAQKLDVNMYACALMLQQTSLASYLKTREVPRRCGSAAPYSAPNEAFEASDGYMMIAAYQNERWKGLCGVVGLPELAVDPRFSTLAKRVENRAELVNTLNVVFAEQTRAYWLEKLESADIICAPVCDYGEVAESPHAMFNNLLVELDHPVAGRFGMPGFALGGRPAEQYIRYRPPLLGEHTETVLAEFGFSQESIRQLLADEVVR